MRRRGELVLLDPSDHRVLDEHDFGILRATFGPGHGLVLRSAWHSLGSPVA